MRLVSRLAPSAAVAAVAAMLVIAPGTAHARERVCMHDAKAAEWYAHAAAQQLAQFYDTEEAWWDFSSTMDLAYEAAGGYC